MLMTHTVRFTAKTEGNNTRANSLMKSSLVPPLSKALNYTRTISVRRVSSGFPGGHASPTGPYMVV